MDEELTVEALRYYVPIFQRGDKAFLRLLEEGPFSPLERNILETQALTREIALNNLVARAKPLIVVAVHSIIKTSLLKNDEDIFNLIYYAGVSGMVRGLRKFDVKKINESATNYLLQWVKTYAKKELLAAEARPFAIPPSRFFKYKKISAVRKKMEEALKRPPTNEEVLTYFHDGFADVQTMEGPLLKARKSAANQAITLELVIEQNEFEKNMKKVASIEIDDFRNDLLSTTDEINYGILQSFISNTPNLTPKALAYIYSELGVENQKFQEISSSMSNAEYRRIGRMWASLLKDVDGPFYKFAKENGGENMNLEEIGADLKTPVKYDNLFIRS